MKKLNNDADILNQIEDFLVNVPFGTDEPIDGADAVDMLSHIADLLDKRSK